jgi:hypothetical protein
MEIKNSHQVTSVCHCVTRNDQMYVVHIGSNDCCGCGTMTYIQRSPEGQFNPTITIYIDYLVRNPKNNFRLTKFKFYHTYIS